MSVIKFNGIVTIPLPWSSSTIIAASGSPPPANFNDQQSTASISPDSIIIKWNDNVPLSFQGLNINSLVSSDIISGTSFTISRTVINTITSGIQQSEDYGEPLIHLYFLDNKELIQGYDITSLEWNVQPCLSGFGPNENGYSYPLANQNPSGNLTLQPIDNVNTNNFQKLTTLQVSPWNECNQCPSVVNFDCENRNVTNFTMNMVMNVSISIPCLTSFDLQTQFCLNYCNQPNNQISCFPQYEQFCLIETGTDNNINLFTNKACDSFITQYLSTQGPQAEVDNKINAACAQYDTVEKFNAVDSNIQNICACHLPKDIYDKLRDSLIKEFPGFQYVDENERCLFPPCPSSDYKTVSIGKVCALPACINIASINNDGTIKGGAQINQNADCQKAKNQTNINTVVNETETWVEKHWPWLILGASILVVLIMVILIILASEGNKKK